MISLRKKYLSHRGMTLIEILLVVSLISMVSLAIYNALNNGVKVFQRNEQLVIEEDIVIFLDKFSKDLRNSFVHSKIIFKGGEYRFSFPTMVLTNADRRSGADPDEIITQIGRVEYFFDLVDDVIYRRQANYSQAINERFGEKRPLVSSVQNLKFRYFYFTNNEEIYSQEVLDTIPSGVEVEIEFNDMRGTRSLKKFIHIPIGS